MLLATLAAVLMRLAQGHQPAVGRERTGEGWPKQVSPQKNDTL